MHEYSITCSILEILDRVIKENNLKKVRKISWDTALLGESGSIFFDNEEILSDVLTLYFTDYEPESCLLQLQKMMS